ncbi:MAG: beta strand repeat-containing protein [Thermoguttaceae bacterium]
MSAILPNRELLQTSRNLQSSTGVVRQISRRLVRAAAILALASLLASNRLATAQPVVVSYTTSGSTYLQDFDTLADSSGTAAPEAVPSPYALTSIAGASGMTGWYASAAGTLKYGVDIGTLNTGALYSYAPTAGTSNAALGIAETSATGQIIFGVGIQNDTGQDLNTANISFLSELFHQNTVQKALQFSYYVDPSSTVTLPSTGNPVSSVSFGTGPSGAVNPFSNPSSYQQLESTTLSLVGSNDWSNGSTLWLTWTLSSSQGGGQGLAIDNLSLVGSYSASATTPANVTWNTTSGDWDTTSPNWTGGIPNNSLYKSNDFVTFGNIASNSVIAISSSGVTPGSVTVSNSSNQYTFQGGPINGNTGLIISGGALNLTSANNYSGGTTISGGTLTVTGGDSRLGVASGGIALAGEGVLVTSGAGLNSSRNLTLTAGLGGGTFNSNGFNSSFSGTAQIDDQLTKTGSGDLAITGAVTFNQAAGGVAAVNVQNGTVTLGSVSGVTINQGTLTTSGSGTLTFYSPNFKGTATLNIQPGSNVAFYNNAVDTIVPGTTLPQGANINGNLALANVQAFYLGGGTISGGGAIQVQAPGAPGNSPDSGAYGYVGTTITDAAVTTPVYANINFQLNSNNLPFTKADVTAPTFALPSVNNFVTIFGGSKIATNDPSLIVIGGAISGDSDVCFGANDPDGSGSGDIMLSASNAYAGVTMINGKNAATHLGVDNALPIGTDLIFGTMSAIGGAGNWSRLDLNGHNQTVGSLSSGPYATASQLITNGNQVGNPGNGVSPDDPWSNPGNVAGGFPNPGAHGNATLTISGTLNAAPYAGTIIDGSNGGQTYTVAIAKAGPNTLILSGYNTYSGGTTISGGILQVSNVQTDANGSALGVGPVDVQNGGSLAGSPNVNGTYGGGVTGPVTVEAGGQLLPGGLNTGGKPLYLMGGLTLDGSSSVSYDYGAGLNGKDLVTVGSGTLTLPTGSNSAIINLNVQQGLSGIIPLFTFGSLAQAFSASELQVGTFTNLPPGVNKSDFTFELDSVARPGGNANQIDLVDPNLPFSAFVTWNTASGLWNTSTASTNWTGGSPNPTAYKDGDEATFADYASSSSTVTIDAGGVQPNATTISNKNTSYTFAGGPIAGYGPLTMSGSGVATLSASNSYSGGTYITGGTLVVNGGDNRLGAAGTTVTFDTGGVLQTAGTGLISGRPFYVNAGGGTFDSNGLNSSTSGSLNMYGDFTKAGSGSFTITGPTVLNGTSNLIVTGGSLVLQNDTVSLTPSTSASISSGANLVLALPTSTDIVTMQNGGIFNGNLVMATPFRLNFDAGTYSGTGAIQVQNGGEVSGGSLASTAIITNSNKSQSNREIDCNIQLNSLSLPFTKYDVTQSSFSFSPSSTFVTTIGGTKLSSGLTYSLYLNGAITGNSDVNFANSAAGGGAGSIYLGGSSTYTGATMFNGGSGTVFLNTNNALPTTTDVIFGTVSGVGGTTLDLNGHSQTVASLSDGPFGHPSNWNIVNGVNATGSAILTVSGTVTPARAFSGILADIPGSPSLALVKAGPNTLTLTGANAYSGGTTVQGGALLLNNANSAQYPAGIGDVMVNGGTLGGIATLYASSNGLTVNAGGTVAPGLPGQPGTLNASGNATLNAGANASFDFGLVSKSLLSVDSTLNLPSSGQVTINLTNDGSLSGTLPLFTYGNLENTFSASQLTVGSAPDPASRYSFVNSNGTISIVAPYLLTWSGSTSNAWDTANTPNFTDANNNGNGTFHTYDHVTFNDNGSGGTIAIASSGVTTGPVVFQNSSKSYVLAGGPITGDSLTVSGGGSLVLDNATNTFTGGVMVSSGTLTLDSADVLENGTSLTVGTGAGAIAFNALAASGASVGSSAGNPVAVPEPCNFALLAAGAIVLALRASRRRPN